MELLGQGGFVIDVLLGMVVLLNISVSFVDIKEMRASKRYKDSYVRLWRICFVTEVILFCIWLVLRIFFRA